MILDQLSNAAIYRKLSDRFAAGFDYLARTNLTALPDGRYEIVGRDVYAIVQTSTTKPRDQGRWEAHRHYADIQFMIRGAERMGIAPLPQMRLLPPYDPEKDVEFYEGDGRFIDVSQGSFAVFLPQDVHMPGLAIGDAATAEVKKAVIKVRVR